MGVSPETDVSAEEEFVGRFPLDVDCEAISAAAEALRLLQELPGLSEDQKAGITHALQAVEELPAASDVDVDCDLWLEGGSNGWSERRYWSITINHNRFSLSNGGSVYTEGVGSDSYSGYEFCAELEGYQSENGDLYTWLEGLRDACELNPRLEVRDGSVNVDRPES